MFPWHSKKYKTTSLTEERKIQLKTHSQTFKIPIIEFSLWDLALTHISFLDSSDGVSYERLEFLGDSVLGLCIADILYENYSLSEGRMSSIKSSIVNEKTLSFLAEQLKLLDVVKLGNGEKLNDKRAQEKVLCDLFESTLAVIFIQQGFKKARDFVVTMFSEKINQVLQEGIWDAKTKLQRITVKVYKVYPTYTIVDTEGPDHGKIFTVQGTVDKFTASGKGRSKKDAEQQAAQLILQEMTEIVANHPDSVLAKELLNVE